MTEVKQEKEDDDDVIILDDLPDRDASALISPPSTKQGPLFLHCLRLRLGSLRQCFVCFLWRRQG